VCNKVCVKEREREREKRKESTMKKLCKIERIKKQKKIMEDQERQKQNRYKNQ
jgi:hypothetical protein